MNKLYGIKNRIKAYLFNLKRFSSTRPPFSNHVESEQNRSAILLIDSDGLSWYTAYLARGLSRYRDVTLYGFSKEDYFTTGADKEERIKFYWLKEKLPKKYSTIRGIARVFLLFFILLIVLNTKKYSTVHIQEHLPTFFLFIPILKIKRKQICWTLHDVNIFAPSENMHGKLQVLFLKIVSGPNLMGKYADLIIVHAHSLKRKLMERGIGENKISVIRHTDYRYLLEYYSKDNNKSDKCISYKNYALFFGNIAPWKGVDILIRAARIVNKRLGNKFTILIAGRAWEGYNYDDMLPICKEDYEYIQIINRYITGYEIPNLLKNSAFLVLPYTQAFQYSVSGVIPLAYTFSKPVIVSDIPSLAEYVDHGKTGFLFETGNSSQLADYVIELLENNSRCTQMGKNAYQKMIQEMSLEKCCKILNDLYY